MLVSEESALPRAVAFSALPRQERAEARSDKRRVDRQRIHGRVVHPIDTPRLIPDPLERPRSRLVSTVTSLRLLSLAAVVHGLVILLFFVFNQLVGGRSSYQPPERVQVRIVETPPPPFEMPDEDEAPPRPVPPDFVEAVAAAEPDEVPKQVRPIDRAPEAAPNPPTAPPEVAPRRVVGLELESTVEGGGPAFAVGTSRMGKTDRRATDPERAMREPLEGISGSGRGAAPNPKTEQRAATLIPTRDSVFVKPKRSHPSKPPYPATLKAQGIEGDVQVRVDIDASGRVTRVTVLQGSGHTAFDTEAREAARRERFSPATRDGHPVPYTLSYSYRFRIEDY